MDVFKILKTRTPMALFQNFIISKRKPTLLLPPKITNSYIYNASTLWNKFTAALPPEMKQDFSTKFSKLKALLRNFLLQRQKFGDKAEWINENNTLTPFCN